MFPPDNLNPLMKELMARLGNLPNRGGNTCKNNDISKNNKDCCNDSTNNTNKCKTSKSKEINITPSQGLIIAALLGGVLEVESVLIDRDQSVQIVLIGSLKEKTELEKMMDQIGSMPFDEVMQALLDRFT